MFMKVNMWPHIPTLPWFLYSLVCLAEDKTRSQDKNPIALTFIGHCFSQPWWFSDEKRPIFVYTKSIRSLSMAEIYPIYTYLAVFLTCIDKIFKSWCTFQERKCNTLENALWFLYFFPFLGHLLRVRGNIFMSISPFIHLHNIYLYS